jgi:MerR family transcriptional regulator, thiopeptide resistance regulator
MKTRTYQIKDVADIAGVSTRTLRHYDELGLLAPSARSAAGYRLYTDSDLLRLQQILIGRSLGLALEEIRQTIDDPKVDRKALLQQQREVLVARAQATVQMIQSIDAAISLLAETPQEDSTMNMTAIFDGFDPAQYEAEVKQRWGSTDLYKESTRRTRNYTKQDWERVRNESNQIMNDAVALLRADTKPEDPQAMDIAERYRLWVDRWFYPCSRGMHTKLADMYQGDSRFAQYFENFAPGLATFVSASMRANAERGYD